jgi:multicomponent Na+:H+ antiporter subunit E
MFFWLVPVLLLSLVWMMLTGRLALDSFILGAVLSLAIVVLLVRSTTKEDGRIRFSAFLRYLGVLFRQIAAGDALMVRRILSRQPVDNAGVFELPVGREDESTAALSAHAITSSPGSLVIDFLDDGKTMLVHTIDLALQPGLEADQRRRAELCGRMLNDE